MEDLLTPAPGIEADLPVPAEPVSRQLGFDNAGVSNTVDPHVSLGRGHRHPIGSLSAAVGDADTILAAYRGSVALPETRVRHLRR